uniref:Small ribosomal subunit protein uS13m n=1 Tax=Jaagichlorella roystonensis TaxID=1052852 RepID=A0A6C0M9L3_9CHLO|nr:30S ribosomal protein S13 [Jaagichlorella roystonensis]YP_009733054.1 30S ribosomal protein S13 [Jaagichlorella roystonensis]QHU78306.1 30S ribosomal protein S13 [Jaagichlorella roystonensis]QHU78350.1 30S ribosomal protein S13 [Jaagichlorella roystonensis]
MIIAFNHHFSENTQVKKALTIFSGIGKSMAIQVLDRVGVIDHIKLKNLSASQLAEIKAIVEQNYEIDNERLAIVTQNIKRLSSITSYRGFRHNLGLPCRGQRSHSNAKTIKRLKKGFKLKHF